MNYHIITPFIRKENLSLLQENFKGFTWHRLEETDHYKKIADVIERVATKINDFLDTELIDDDYYTFMCDDDAFEEGYLEKIKQFTDDVIVVSLKRGDKTIRPGVHAHPTDTLIASPENMKINSWGLQQLIIKGKILKNYRLNFESTADGAIGEQLKKDMEEQGKKIRFVPDLYVLFNYLEPGIYNK